MSLKDHPEMTVERLRLLIVDGVLPEWFQDGPDELEAIDMLVDAVEKLEPEVVDRLFEDSGGSTTVLAATLAKLNCFMEKQQERQAERSEDSQRDLAFCAKNISCVPANFSLAREVLWSVHKSKTEGREHWVGARQSRGGLEVCQPIVVKCEARTASSFGLGGSPQSGVVNEGPPLGPEEIDGCSVNRMHHGDPAGGRLSDSHEAGPLSLDQVRARIFYLACDVEPTSAPAALLLRAVAEAISDAGDPTGPGDLDSVLYCAAAKLQYSKASEICSAAPHMPDTVQPHTWRAAMDRQFEKETE